MAEDRGSDVDGEPTLEERLQEIEDDVTAKIADVRQRIVQIKMEIDEKAPAGHDHDDLAERLESLEETVDAIHSVEPETVERLETQDEDLEERAAALDEDVEDLREKVGMLASTSVDVQDRLDEFEDTLADHDTILGSAEEKLDMVASSTLDVQDRLEELGERAREQDALDGLQAAANRKGVRRARCGACRTRLDVGLLTEPACPDCEATFVDVEAGGLLRRGRLVTDPRAADPDGSPAADPAASEDPTVPADSDDRTA